MHALKLIFLLTPIFTFAQRTETSISTNLKLNDYSDSRFDIDRNGFYGKAQPDTNYYTPDHKIASIINHAVDKKNRMSGNKSGLSIEYYFNGQIKSQGNYQMYSLLYCRSPKHKRIETSYKVGKWIYYYETGQIKAIGKYKIIDFDSHTGIANQIGKRAVVSGDWKFFNPDGNVEFDKETIIREMEYRLNCN